MYAVFTYMYVDYYCGDFQLWLAKPKGLVVLTKFLRQSNQEAQMLMQSAIDKRLIPSHNSC